MLGIAAAALIAGGILHLPADETARIAHHLERVEAQLRAAPVDHLSPAQRATRAGHLDVLGDYRRRGVFPHNHAVAHTVPVFVDPHGTHCAVGHLLAASGRRDLVARIAHGALYHRVPDIEDPELRVWAEHAGFTVAELTRIQPSYGPYSHGSCPSRCVEWSGGAALETGIGKEPVCLRWEHDDASCHRNRTVSATSHDAARVSPEAVTALLTLMMGFLAFIPLLGGARILPETDAPPPAPWMTSARWGQALLGALAGGAFLGAQFVFADHCDSSGAHLNPCAPWPTSLGAVLAYQGLLLIPILTLAGAWLGDRMPRVIRGPTLRLLVSALAYSALVFVASRLALVPQIGESCLLRADADATSLTGAFLFLTMDLLQTLPVCALIGLAWALALERRRVGGLGVATAVVLLLVAAGAAVLPVARGALMGSGMFACGDIYPAVTGPAKDGTNPVEKRTTKNFDIYNRY
jgi:hypothetical protein